MVPVCLILVRARDTLHYASDTLWVALMSVRSMPLQEPPLNLPLI